MKILVVDDDRVLADLVSFTLRRAGYSATHAGDAATALRLFEKEKPDLAILDINLPGTEGIRDGFDLCKHLRAKSDMPVILLTVRGEEEDIVFGLEAGADDYILKPFSPRQLVARVGAVLRRTNTPGKSSPQACLTFKGMEFNPRLREARLEDGTLHKLTPMESRLLEALMLNAGQVLTSDELISDVWGAGGGNTEMLRQLVRRLRTKIESDPGHPQYIENHPGLGYSIGLKR